MRTFVVNGLHRLMKLGFDVKRSEVVSVAWSFCYFFFLLSSYYVLRPLRDEMGIQGGVENLPWMFTGTFLATLVVVPIFGSIASNVSKRRIAPAFYGFFLLVLLGFYGLLASNVYPQWVAIAFFIWVSVFNLFVMSVFWSFMVDVFSSDQSERLFGFVAAGGTTGAIVGPALASTLPPLVGTDNLLLVSAGLLSGTLLCIYGILGNETAADSSDDTSPSSDGGSTGEEIIGGNFWDGFVSLFRSPYLLGIGLFIVLYSSTSTFVYFEQANIVEDAIGNSARRTQIFALIDFAVNALTLVGQIFVTGRLTDRFGPGPSLVSLPLVTVLGFLALGLSPILITLIVFQVVRRASNYALSKPARETLFSPLTDSEKYKGKNIVDTLIYRAGDAASGWVFAGFQALGLSLAGIAFVGAGFAVGWILLCYALVRGYHDKVR